MADFCTVSFIPETHPDYPNQLHYLNAHASHPDLGLIAKMRCLIVSHRNDDDFLQVMDDESHEMMQFSRALFDAYGSVQPWLIDGGYRSGSMCWGEELNIGLMVYIEDLNVVEQFRDHGVGSWLLQKLFQSPFTERTGYRDHVAYFCWPMPPKNQLNANNWDEKVEQVNTFFRKNGFRRVGRTSFFGYSPDPNHPSRRLPIEKDPDRQRNEFEDAPEISPEQFKRQYPLHSAIAINNTVGIAAFINVRHVQNPLTIHQPDNTGFTPIHVAAWMSNLPAVCTLLSLGVEDDLRNVLNKEYMTPLDKLQDTMRQTRELTETIFRRWDGHAPQSLACEYLLKTTLGMPLMAESEGEYVFKRRLGCTCGSCAKQWLSSRMLIRLQSDAQVNFDCMQNDLVSINPDKPIVNAYYSILSTSVSYLPPKLRIGKYKTFFQGYRSVLLAIRDVLNSDHEDNIPTPARVLAEALNRGYNISPYIDQGGRVEYALDAVISAAQEQSALGDGSFEELWEGEDEVNEGLINAPKCANDLAFGLVRCQLGMDPRVVRGPYPQEDFELDGDDDEDQDDAGSIEFSDLLRRRVLM